MLRFLAQASGGSGPLEFWQLGVIAAALVAGAALAHRWMVIPAEKRADNERAERIAAQAQAMEAIRLTTPIALTSNAVLDRVAALLPDLERRSP